MSIKLGVIMDPIQSINIKKDSTFEMLLQAQSLGWQINYMEMNSLFIDQGEAFAHTKQLEVMDNKKEWFNFNEETTINLDDLDVILMRKDPPFDMEYIYSTYILELAQQQGCLIVNNPQALRDCNEKAFTSWFPNCAPPTLISRNNSDIRGFLGNHKDIIIKPLDGMGGASIFRVTEHDPNISVIIETITKHNSSFVMAQRYIPDIKNGDKRILMIDGDPVEYALARIPAEGETRGNLAAGGQGIGQPLSDRDREIASIVGPELKKRGIIFAGLDVIGDYLTEVNVTSPTCIKELNQQFDLNIAMDLMKVIEKKLA